MLALILGCIIGIIVLALRSEGLSVVFLDVGQGDAILISQGSQQILIDGGRDGKLLLEKLGAHIPFWDRNIEIVIMTHPDADHIAGLVDGLRAYKVETIIKTDVESDSQVYKTLAGDIEKENAQVIEAVAGEKIKLPKGGELEILYPLAKDIVVDKNETNSASVVAKLSYGKNEFLFTGDLPSEQESMLIGDPLVQNSRENDYLRVLKVGHHGSKYSTSDILLDALKSKDAIISVGAHNTYGHPNQEIIDRLLHRGINTFRTDKSGDIKYSCKNQEINCVISVEK